MNKIILRPVVVAAAMLFSTGVFAAEFGTAEEAKAMLDRAVAAVKADSAGALAKINAGEAEFRDRDLYPFCAGADGITTAHGDPGQLGKQIRDIMDVDRKSIGELVMNAVEEGKVNEVSYKWPRPGTEEPTLKVSFVTKIGGQICGVGYHK